MPADLAIIASLMQHSSPDVRRLAVHGAGRMGRHQIFEEQAAALIAHVDVNGDWHVADAICSAFNEFGMPFSVLTKPQIQRILQQFLSVSRLDDPDHRDFFSRVAATAPDLLFEFLYERLGIYSERPMHVRKDYVHWGQTSPAAYLRNSVPPIDIGERLRRVRDLMLLTSVHVVWVAELFWSFGDASGESEVVLKEWHDSGDPEKRNLSDRLRGASVRA